MPWPGDARQPSHPLAYPRRVSQRLGARRIERMVAEYQSGTSTTRLTVRYHIVKGTLLRLIHESGVTVRCKGPLD